MDSTTNRTSNCMVLKVFIQSFETWGESVVFPIKAELPCLILSYLFSSFLIPPLATFTFPFPSIYSPPLTLHAPPPLTLHAPPSHLLPSHPLSLLPSPPPLALPHVAFGVPEKMWCVQQAPPTICYLQNCIQQSSYREGKGICRWNNKGHCNIISENLSILSARI